MLDLLLIPLTLMPVADKVPEPEDVKAGYTALLIFLGLALAVVVLGFSLVKHLRRAEAAKDAGLYGDEPVAPAGDPDDTAGTGVVDEGPEHRA